MQAPICLVKKKRKAAVGWEKNFRALLSANPWIWWDKLKRESAILIYE